MMHLFKQSFTVIQACLRQVARRASHGLQRAGKLPVRSLRRPGKTLFLSSVILARVSLVCSGPCRADEPLNSSSTDLSQPARSTATADPRAKLQTELAAILKRASTDGRYVPTSRHELQVSQQLFAETVLGETKDTVLQRAWSRIGWELSQLGPRDRRLWVLREQADRKEGRGLFAFRRDTDPRIAIEAPHAFYDRHTREIALHLFVQGHFSAIACNTVHRSVCDLAHAKNNCLTSFTRAFVASGNHTMVVQLHGFSRRKRRFAAGAAADVILSDGTRSPDRWLFTAGAIMDRGRRYGTVRCFPSEIHELGGTTNAQGTAIRQVGAGRFLHIEMSKSLRLRLAEDPLTRRQLLKDLAAIYRTSPR